MNINLTWRGPLNGWPPNCVPLGMDRVQIMPTGGHPVVFGEWLGAGADKPTVLIYGHYDVQPVDPIDLWKTPPLPLL